MSTSLSHWLAAKARALEARGLTRHLQPRQSLALADSDVIELASNDYLGLSTDPRVVAASQQAIGTWGTGATGSRLVSGSTELHQQLEADLADWCGQPAALVFSSGYLANLAVVTTLSDPGTLVVMDAHAHASLLDAARLCRARVESFAHNNIAAARTLLHTRREPRALVLTESVFSVLGDAGPLVELGELCAETDAVLVVDEAHALGVTGSGRGSVAHTGLASGEHVVVTATLSKALASQGGVVLGSRLLRDHLVNRARPFMFDTGLAPASAAAALAALDVVRDEPKRVERLHKVTCSMVDACAGSPVAGAVLSVPVGSPERALEVARTCLEQGVRVGVFRPPSVPDGVSRIRLAGRATLTEDELSRVCTVLAAEIGGAA